MAKFALMKGDRVYEIVDAIDVKELSTRYTPELVALMVDVTGKDVRQHMARDDRGEFAEPPILASEPTPLSADKLAAILITKGVLSAEDLSLKG